MTWACQFCGSQNDSQCFPVWHKDSDSPGLCFQQLVIAGTANALFAVVSAFSAGHQYEESKRYRRSRPSRILTARFYLSILMTLTYLTEGIASIWLVPRYPPVAWSVYALGVVTWATHSFSTWAARRNILFDNRQLGLILTWIFTLLSSSLQFYTAVKLKSWPGGRSSQEWSNNYGYPHALSVLIQFGLQLCYMPTILLKVRQPFSAGLQQLIGSMAAEGQPVDIQGERQERQPLLRRLSRTQYSFYGTDSRNEMQPLVAEEGANCLSWLFFWWVGDLMVQGSEGRLERPEQLPLLPTSLRTQRIRQKFAGVFGKIQEEDASLEELDFTGSVESQEPVTLRETWAESFESSTGRRSPSPSVESLDVSNHDDSKKPKARRRTLWVALNRTFGWQYYPLGILKLIADLLGFSGPLLLNKLVSLMEHPSSDVKNGYYYAAGLSLATLLAALISSQFMYLVNRVGVQVRAAVITAVYGKALAVSTATMQEFSTGQVVNFMSTDTDRIVNFCLSFHQFWSLPFQVAVALYLLHQQVGLAFLAGVAFALLLVPINRWLAIKIGKLSTAMMDQKDNRVKVMSEVLAGIRVVKFYAWESHFSDKVTDLRSLELKSLKGRKYLDALCVYFWATTPVLISILTFATYTGINDEKLTAAKVFTSVALFNMLISPLNAFPWVLNGLIEAWVSLKRVQEFMWLKELNLAEYYVDMPPFTDHRGSDGEDGEEPAVQIVMGKFAWPPADGRRMARSTLRSVNLTVRQGQLLGVCGKVGAGKSSLLAAMTAEMQRTAGRVFVSCLETGFGAAFQEAWIQHATIRDNILFGQVFNQHKYDHVIHACALTEDLSTLPSGDQTEVGENGVTLSGGQKARVALARAVYQDKDVYLLDDPLAAVDANVGAHLFQECILGLLKGKTRILCTHHTQFLMSADVVVLMDNGRIAAMGSPHEVFSHYTHVLANPAATGGPEEEMTSVEINKASDDEVLSDSFPAATQEKGVLVKEEEKEVGAVAIHVYKSYWLAVGSCLAASIFIALFLMQASRNLSDWWLSYWVTESKGSAVGNSTNIMTYLYVSLDSYVFQSNRSQSSTKTSDDIGFYLGVYGGLAAANSVFTLFRAFLYAYGGICAATVIHKHLLGRILQAPIAFFDVTPIGRIVNRFSSDVYAIDDSLPFILNILLAQIAGVLGTIAVTCYGLPWFALALVPLAVIYYFIQRYYRRTSRELKRLSTVTLSPIYAHFSESLTGLATIRAFRQTERFAEENEQRVDLNQRANFGGYAAGQWLGIRLQLLGVAMVTSVAFIAVLQHNFSSVNPGLVGLALSYALSVTALLSGVITSFTETEKQMVSVERAKQYIDGVPKERGVSTPVAAPGWPSEGVVCFRHVSLVYRSGLPPALTGVSFQTRPMEKVGIVGRTGAGKSSLFLCLFQMVQLSEGTVFIDGVDVSSITQQSLRCRLAVIPQDPFLFNGTVRENLDPCVRCDDSQLWSILEKCHLREVIETIGGLSGVVSERGRNFSVGQRQLVCLARALLTRAKVLCIDEATASVDKTTDHCIQQTIREEFSESTVLTIAHRIETILDSDRILCMDQGRVVDFGPPNELLADQNSLFSLLTRNPTA